MAKKKKVGRPRKRARKRALVSRAPKYDAVTRDQLVSLRDGVEGVLDQARREVEVARVRANQMEQAFHTVRREMDALKINVREVRNAMGFDIQCADAPGLREHVAWSYFHVWIARMNARFDKLEQEIDPMFREVEEDEGRPRMRRVIVESPYKANANHSVEDHVAYARACVSDCVRRGESPIASHLLFTQPGILDDNNPFERKVGIEAGTVWFGVADAVVFYLDLGWSEGMYEADKLCAEMKINAEQRTIGWSVQHESEHRSEGSQGSGSDQSRIS